MARWMMNSLSLQILRVIDRHDGVFSWYQIDRELVTWSLRREENRAQMHRLMDYLRDLEKQNLIRSAPGHSPSQPLYSLTAAGRELLHGWGTGTIEVRLATLELLAGFVLHRVSADRFESFVYGASRLEQEIGEDAYLELLAFDYSAESGRKAASEWIVRLVGFERIVQCWTRKVVGQIVAGELEVLKGLTVLDELGTLVGVLARAYYGECSPLLNDYDHIDVAAWVRHSPEEVKPLESFLRQRLAIALEKGLIGDASL